MFTPDLARTVIVFIVFSAVGAFKTHPSPRFVPKSALNANIVDTASGSGNFKTFIAALNAAGLTSTLVGSGPFTVFAPTDAAFEKLPTGTLDGLLKNIPQLKRILQFHIHPAKMNPTRNGRSLDTLCISEDGFPKQLSVKVTNWSCESFIFGGQATPAFVTELGVKCDNGLIHIIDEVLFPYEGNKAPIVTHIGGRDMDGTKTLQQGFYGPEAGKGLGYNGGKKGKSSVEELGVGSTWKVTANYEYEVKKADGTVDRRYRG